MAKQKKSGFKTILYTFGSILIAVMLIIVGINFSRDARLFQKPLLSTSGEKKTESTDPEGYKTIKYEKPTETTAKESSKSGTKSTNAPKPSGPAATTPTTRADP